jgi:rod shape-determining protein MreC
MVIDRGFESGVLENDIVVAGSRRLVGKVRIASARFARVTLVGDRSFRASAKITDTSGAAVPDAALYEGLLQGKGLGCASIDMVPATALLKEGDEVLTSGFDGVFPPYLVIGRIRKILSGPSDFFQRASLDLAVDIGELDVVSVIPGSR